MIKVVGLWDGGWATGVKLAETFEQWELEQTLTFSFLDHLRQLVEVDHDDHYVLRV